MNAPLSQKYANSFSPCRKSSPRRAATSRPAPGATWSAAPRPRPRCAATASRSIRSRFRPRVLRDVSRIDSSAEFLSRKVRLPVLLAPIGGLESIVEGGAAAAARGAAAFGVPQMLSSVCQPGLEATAAAADTLRVFQLYVRGDDAWVDDHVKRALDHGYAAFCLTVDVAMYSRRERDLVGRFVKPWRATAPAGSTYQSGLSWDQVKRFKDKHWTAAAHHQGHRHGGGRRDRRAARRRGRLRLQPRRPPARPRAGQRRGAAGDRRAPSPAAPRSGWTAASCAAPTS